jgi:sulfur carrier protein
MPVEGSDQHRLPAASRPFLLERTMQIIINGEPRTIGTRSVRQLLEDLDIDPRRVAVELNSAILPKSDYESSPLNDGDRIEIVHFVGGG